MEAVKYSTVGKHAIAEFFDCKNLTDDKDEMERVLVEAVKVGKMNIVEKVICKFEPQGLTGAIVLKESHLTIHTYPEEQFAAIDVFSCGNEGQPQDAVDYLKEVFQPDETSNMFLTRGVRR